MNYDLEKLQVTPETFPKDKFQIGDVILATKTAEVRSGATGNNRRDIYLTQVVPPSLMVITGVAIRQLGEIKTGQEYHTPFDYEPPATYSYLAVDQTIYLWECKKGMTNKPVLVPNYCAVLFKTLGVSNYELPFRFQRQTGIDERYREDMRKIMKDHPRDEKGRWISLRD